MDETRTTVSGPRPVEVGWVVPPALRPEGRAVVERARELLRERLAVDFPGFAWHVPLAERSPATSAEAAEPVDLLEEGVRHREAHRWDFALVVTDVDLASHSRPFALAAPSRALGVAALSLARLGEGEVDAGRRLANLALHLLGDLNGLPHRDGVDAVMRLPEGPEDLDAMQHLDDEEASALVRALEEVADPRLEEEGRRHRSAAAFHLRAGWRGRREIASAVLQARPWLFPVRLSKLSTAALSALVLLLMTAEVWDLGMRQPPLRVAVLSLVVLATTSLFLLVRQRLIAQRGRRLGEQVVFARFAVVLVVVLGMATTYAVLFVLALGASAALFPASLVEGWAASLPGRAGPSHYLVLAGFVASVGLGIGALGASFEGQRYIRHVTYVDEET